MYHRDRSWEILSRDEGYRGVDGQSQHAIQNELTLCEQLNSLSGSQFGQLRSTEAMMLGTSNEATAL